MRNAIEVSQSDSYVNATLYVDTDDTPLVFRRTPEYLIKNYKHTGKEKRHTVTMFDTCRSIALTFYDGIPDAQYYHHVIADINGIPNPVDLSSLVGKEIIIPDYLRYSLS